MQKKILFVLIVSLISLTTYSQIQKQEATTANGVTVILYSDGTWKLKDSEAVNNSAASSGVSSFVGTWVNNGRKNGEVYPGSTVTIRSENGNLIVRFKGGGDDLQNTGTYSDGKIKVTLSWMGETQITYSSEDGVPHIYFFGTKMDKR